VASDQLVAGAARTHYHRLQQAVLAQTVGKLGDAVDVMSRVARAGLDRRDRQRIGDAVLDSGDLTRSCRRSGKRDRRSNLGERAKQHLFDGFGQ
jgi:hypothetical protein